MKDDKLYLIHINECIERIENYVSSGKESFLQSPLIQDAVLHNLQTLAESTQRLSDAIKQDYPSIDWRRISGLRNILVHDYLGVDIPRVWTIIDKELPLLSCTIHAMLQDIESRN